MGKLTAKQRQDLEDHYNPPKPPDGSHITQKALRVLLKKLDRHLGPILEDILTRAKPRTEACQPCFGTGLHQTKIRRIVPGAGPPKCPLCNGTGEITIPG